MRSQRLAAVVVLFVLCPISFAARLSDDRVRAVALNKFESSGASVTIKHPQRDATFSPSGVTINAANGTHWQWSIDHVSAGGHDVALACDVPPVAATDALSVTFNRGAALERYIARASTIEQTFVIEHPLPSGDVVIEGSVASNSSFKRVRNGWQWGAVTLGDVTVIDAAGRTLCASMSARADRTRITIDGDALRGAKYPITVDPEIGTQDFRISTMGTDGNLTATVALPSVAYNTDRDEYLVVWQGFDDRGESEIWGRIVPGSGTITDSGFKISDMGSTHNVCCSDPQPYFNANAPRVAYNSTDKEYFVVWRGDDDRVTANETHLDNDNEIFAQRVDGATRALKLTTQVRISQMGPDTSNGYNADVPAVAWDSFNDRYLVVYHGSDDCPSSMSDTRCSTALLEGETEIWGRLVNANGTTYSSNEIRISETLPDASYFRSAFNPDVAYDSVNHRFLVVWSSDTTPLDDNENEIWGQFITAAGADFGTDFRISDMGASPGIAFQASTPAVAFNPDAGEFLVVWAGDDTSPGDDDTEIWGQRINASTGAEVGTNDFRISNMGTDGDTRFGGSAPALSYDSTTQQYLVVWTGAVATVGDVEVWGQRLSSSGASVGRSDYRISEVGVDGQNLYSPHDAAIATGGSGTMLVVWYGNDDQLPSGESEVWGQLFKMTNNAPVVTLPDTPSFTEDGGAIALSSSATVSDDSEDFTFGNLTVQFTANGSSDDVLAITNQGTGAGQIGVSGSNVTYGGTIIGTYAGGGGTTPLVVTFTEAATPTNVQALVKKLTFNNTSQDPTTATRTVSVAVNDGDGQTGSATINVTVTSVLDSPSITMSGGSLSYFKGNGATVIDSGATVTDPDPTTWSGGTLTVSYTANGSVDDRLEIRNEGTSAGQIGVSGSNVTYGGTTIGTYAGGSGTMALVVTFNSSASTAASQALVRNVTFRNVSTTPSTATRTVQFVITIGAVAGGAGTRDITVTIVNSAPAITLPGGTLTYNEDAAATVIDATATITDSDSSDFSTGTLTIDTTAGGTTDDRLAIRNQGISAGQIGVSGSNVTYGGTTIGTFSGGSGTTALVITFNDSSSPAAAQALARNITYQNAADEPPPSSRTVRFAISDGDGGSANASTTINLVATDDAPIVTLPSGAATFTEGNGPVVLDAAATVTDIDSTDFNGGTLTVDYAANGTSTDILSIQSAGNIGVSGNTVSFGANAIGTFSGGNSGTPLVVTLNANATPTTVQELVRNVTFQNASSSPSTQQRSVRFQLSDGDGATSTPVTKAVNVIGISDPAVITLAAGSLAYTENDPATVIDVDASVYDVDSPDFDNGSLVIDFSANGTVDDRLGIKNGGQIATVGTTVTYGGTTIGTFSGGSGTTPLTILLVAPADTTSVTALLRAITFNNVSDNPSTATRTVRFVIDDGDGAVSGGATRDVAITATNDNPVVTLSITGATFVEDGGAVSVDATATVSDADSAHLGTLAVDIFENQSVDDRLGIRNQGTGAGQIGTSGSNVTYGGTTIGTFSGGGASALSFTFNAFATPAAMQALVRNITFDNISNAPSLAGRTVRFVLTDGDGGSTTAGVPVTISATNDAPTVTLPSGALNYIEGSAAMTIDSAATVSDADSTDFATGTMTISMTNASVDDRLEINNQGTSAGQIGTSGSNVTYGGTTIGTFSGGSGTTALVISFNAASTPAAAQALARNLTFRNVSTNPSTVARTASFVISDGDGGTSNAATKTINVTAVNDAPVVTLPSGALSWAEHDAAKVIDAAATVSDVDSADFSGGTLTISMTNVTVDDRLEIVNEGTSAGQIGTSGSNVSYGGTTIGTFTGGSGASALVITFNASSTPAAAQALARKITFRNVSSNPSTTARVVSFVVADGDGGTSSAATKTINVSGDGCLTDATHFGVSGSASVVSGNALTITITPRDAAEAANTCYTGTVQVTSGDAQATLPSNFTFTSGTSNHAFSVTLRSVGTQTVTFTDTVTSSIVGSINITVTAPTTTALSSSVNPSLAGQSVTFTASVTSGVSGTITGTVTFKDGTSTLGSSSVSSGSAAFTTSSLTQGSHSITAVYSGNYDTSTSSAVTQVVNSSSFGPPAIFSATTASASSVTINWTAVSGVTGYEIYRASAIAGPYSLIASPAASAVNYTDGSLAANTTYIYKMLSKNGATASAYTSIDTATTVVFTDTSLTATSSIIKAVHVTELRTAVNAMRSAANLTAATFTDSSLSGVFVKRLHVTELRTALDQARTAMGLSALTYTDSTITTSSTKMKAVHITELRSGVQ